MKTIIFGSTDDYCELLLNDLIKQDDIILFNDEVHINNKYVKLIYKIIWKFNILFPYLGTLTYSFHNWYLRKLTNNANFSYEEKYLIIIFDARDIAYNITFIKFLRKKIECKVVLFFWNPITKTLFNEKKHKKLYDLIITSIKEEKPHFKVLEIPSFYSKIQVRQKEVLNDIFFIGADKKRIDFIHAFYKKAKLHGLKCDFYITGVQKDKCMYDEIHYNCYIPYKEVLEKIASSKCILEVIQSGTIDSTLRTKEAIVYNKLLITTNLNVVFEKFYNDQYIRIISSIDDFDFSFIKDIKNVDYKYSGEFSPNAFLDKIVEKLEE